MWPFIRKQNNTISISLNPQYLTCCWLNKINSKDIEQKIAINAYEKTELKALEFEGATIFNPTKISATINNFIKKNKIYRPVINIAISGPNVIEKIITLSTSNPTEQDFNLENIFDANTEKNINNLKINYTYLCPDISDNANIGFNFYICAISQARLFQYKLLTIKNNSNLTLITTELACLIELYKNIKDKNFNQSQLAIDLSVNNYDIKHLFSPEVISCFSQVNNSLVKNNLNINLTQESQFLAVSLGLFLLGDKI